jgi:hypothetical protein
MLNMVALYRGQTLKDTKTVTVTSDPRVIRRFITSVLELTKSEENDPSLRALSRGEEAALKSILREMNGMESQ